MFGNTWKTLKTTRRDFRRIDVDRSKTTPYIKQLQIATCRTISGLCGQTFKITIITVRSPFTIL